MNCLDNEQDLIAFLFSFCRGVAESHPLKLISSRSTVAEGCLIVTVMVSEKTSL